MPPAGVPPVAVADVGVPVCAAVGDTGAASVVALVAAEPSAGVPVSRTLPVELAPEGRDRPFARRSRGSLCVMSCAAAIVFRLTSERGAEIAPGVNSRAWPRPWGLRFRDPPHAREGLMEKISSTLVNWASILDQATRAQAETTATMPFIHPHVALMPDAHLGLGATVGSVIPTIGAIMPAAVGVDIGCGMIAVRTQFSRNELPRYAVELREAIERAVPLSAGVYNTAVTLGHTAARVTDLEERACAAEFDPAAYAANWRLQVGTLGSGNHFIEVTVDAEDRVWLFLHSGSRGVGNKIAQHHIRVAQQLNAQWWISLPHNDLAYLVDGTDEFWAYIRRDAVGAALRAAQPGGDDGPGGCGLRGMGRRGRGAARGDQLPPQLHRAGEALRQARCGSRARAPSRRGTGSRG